MECDVLYSRKFLITEFACACLQIFFIVSTLFPRREAQRWEMKKARGMAASSGDMPRLNGEDQIIIIQFALRVSTSCSWHEARAI